MARELTHLTAHELSDLLRRREVSAVEVTEAYLERIQEVDGQVKAFLTVTPEQARQAAQEADRRFATEPVESLPPLLGVPGALKDNMCTAGIRTTCASKILHNFIPPYDATVVAKAKTAGAPILGKCNMDEFAMGSSTENSGFFTTRNPYDLERVPGGSSGGSAAAVAADEAAWSLGSDTGGSIRQPAAFCGIVGLKPTYGAVSRYGLVAFASSLDQIGPLTKDVTDCALVMNLIAGKDPLDATSVDRPHPDYTTFLGREIKGLRVGVPKEYFVEGLDAEVREKVLAAIGALESLGAEIVEVSLPHTPYALATYYLIAPAEASSNLARYDGVRYGHRAKEAPDSLTMFKKTRQEGFGPEVKRRIMLGTYALSSGYYDAYYLKAQKVRTLFRRDFEAAFQKCDVIASSTTPTVAFKAGEKVDNPLAMYLSDAFTIPAPLAALPALSMPCAYSSEGLPIGLQLQANHFAEGTLFQVAYALEQALGLKRRRPEIPAAPGKEVQ
ncbi:MAG: Asp-tRNA(Asn)/Glu-tRNA(Gln) amidotransferase subunit GatA [Betaproteobacteria bacterium]